jgi:PAS domain S-box-containing protein
MKILSRPQTALPPSALSWMAGIIVALVGSLVLIGWAFDIPLLKSVLPGLATMKTNTALAFVLTGMTLWASHYEGRLRLAQIGALAVFLIGTLTLSEYLFGWNLGIDQFLFRDTLTKAAAFPGRMAQATAFGFTALGLALWLLNQSRRDVLSQILALSVMAMAGLALEGYLYRVGDLYGVFTFSSVALHTAFTLLVAGLGVLLVHPQRGIMAVITADSPGGILARRLLPAVVLAPLIIGWLRLKGQQQGLYGTEFGLALFALANIITFAFLIWWNARLLNRTDVGRKQTKEALRQSEVRFSRIFHASPVATLITRMEDSRIVDVNENFLNMMGYSRDEVIGHTSMELKLLAVPEQRPELLQTLREKGSYRNLELQARTKSGDLRDVMVSSDLIELENQLHIVSMTHDVTQVKQAENALKRYALRMEILHEIDLGLIQGGSIPALVEVTVQHLRQLIPCERADVMILDETTGEAVIFAVDLNGDTKLDTGVRVPIPPNVFEGYDERHLRVFDDIRLFQETRPRAKQLVNEGLLSALSALLVDGEHPIGTLGLFADRAGFFTAEYQDIVAEIASQLTIAIRQMHFAEELARHAAQLEQKVAERTADLTDIKERVEAILNNSADGILLAYSDCRIQQTNAAFNTLLACEADDYFDKSLLDLVQSDEVHPLREAIQSAIAEGRGRDMEARVKRKDGTSFEAELSINSVKAETGKKLDRFVCTIRDITERKQAEERLRQAFEKEKELGELKSRFVSMASHEFRTPLATILALTETLSAYRHTLADDQIEQRLNKIQIQIGHLKNIMDDVLQLSRLQARRFEFNPVKLNLDALCRSVLDEFQSRPDVTHRLLYSCDDTLREVSLDKKLMRQIISNLVSNAIKYSPKDKTVAVSLKYIDESLVLGVRDEGIGIPEADLKHLFEPFHRAANVGAIPGTGLGLVIMKESVELHGGTIGVESQVGVGTTFTVNIPITDKEGKNHDENPGH